MLECPVCGRSACCPIFHKRELQLRYAPAIEAFEQARAIRARIDAELDREGEYVPDEFWTHYEAVTGAQVEEDHRGSFFTCSC